MNDLKQWHVIYTKPNHEMKMADKLAALNIEHFLPLTTRERKWSDRIKKITVPVFKSYIFVFIDSSQYYSIKTCAGFLYFIGFGNGHPSTIPREQISAMQTLNNSNNRWEIEEEKYEEGALIEIMEGELLGLKGILVEDPTKTKMKIEIPCLKKSIVFQVNNKDVRLIKSA